MKKKKKDNAIRNMIKGARRDEMKAVGAYDGRFGTRSEVSDNTYKRNNKHKGKGYDQD